MKFTKEELNDYIIKHPEVQNDLKTLVTLRSLLIEEQQVVKEEKNDGITNGYVKKLGTGSATGGLNMYPVYEKDNKGYSSILMLGLISFLFEILFLCISYFIFK